MLAEPEEYLERVKGYKREIYVAGKKFYNVFESRNLKPTVEAIASTYRLAKNNGGNLHSDLIGEKVNILNSVIKNFEELVARCEFQRKLSLKLATCNYRCTGCDAINSLYLATKSIDTDLGTDYHRRFLSLLKEIQKRDLACTAALTDPKGDRSKRMIEQKDMFVRVVEKRSDGIIVNGAKVHQSGAFAADVNFFLPTAGFFILPSQSFTKEEKAFAISFAVLPEDKGVKYVLQNTGVQAKQRENGAFEAGNPFGDRTTCTIILDNVFIPWDRVFIFENIESIKRALNAFVVVHRCAGLACRAGFIDSMIGAASLMMKASGLEEVPALQQKLAEMVALSEALYGISVGATLKGSNESGIWLPNQVITTSGKILGAEFFSKAILNLIEISGGIIGTAPSEFDLKGEVGELLQRYFKASDKFSTEERLRIVKFIEFWVMSSHLVGSVHGGGSPGSALALLRSSLNLEEREVAVKSILKILYI